MNTISTSTAIEFVRKNLDELRLNGSGIAMIDDLSDSEDLDNTIKATLPEAINFIHLSAPAALLEGLDAANTATRVGTSPIVEIKTTNMDFLRLVRFKMKDSPYTIDRIITENSIEGRMQVNPYTRGTADNPKLVLLSGSAVSNPSFRYYSLKDSTINVEVEAFEYVPLQKAGEDNNGEFYLAAGLEEYVCNYLTGMVLDIYKENQLAQVFYAKASLA